MENHPKTAAGPEACVCVQCGRRAPHLYQRFGGETNIRLSVCGECGGVVDKYVEFEPMLLVIDLILHRREAYRHVLFNRQRLGGFLTRSVGRLVPVFVVLDAYVKWSRVHASGGGEAGGGDAVGWGGGVGLEAQLAALAALAAAEYVAYTVLVVLLLAWLVPGVARTAAGASQAARAVGLSSFGKMFITLAMVWEYEPGFATAIHLFVLSSNITALAALVDSGAGRPAAAVLSAWACKTAFSRIASAAAGLPAAASSLS